MGKQKTGKKKKHLPIEETDESRSAEKQQWETKGMTSYARLF